MEKAAGVESDGGIGIRHRLESLIEKHKSDNQYVNDTDLSGQDWKLLSDKFKEEIKNTLKMISLMIQWISYGAL